MSERASAAQWSEFNGEASWVLWYEVEKDGRRFSPFRVVVCRGAMIVEGTYRGKYSREKLARLVAGVFDAVEGEG